MSVNRAQLQKLAEVGREIADDAEADTNRREGQPFTGGNVAAALGETNAMIAVLGKMVASLAEEMLELHDMVD